jgi:hypothetical protein
MGDTVVVSRTPLDRTWPRFIEDEKVGDSGSKNARGDYTRQELDEKARQWKEQGGK